MIDTELIGTLSSYFMAIGGGPLSTILGAAIGATSVVIGSYLSHYLTEKKATKRRNEKLREGYQIISSVTNAKLISLSRYAAKTNQSIENFSTGMENIGRFHNDVLLSYILNHIHINYIGDDDLILHEILTNFGFFDSTTTTLLRDLIINNQGFRKANDDIIKIYNEIINTNSTPSDKVKRIYSLQTDTGLSDDRINNLIHDRDDYCVLSLFLCDQLMIHSSKRANEISSKKNSNLNYYMNSALNKSIFKHQVVTQWISENHKIEITYHNND